MIRLAVRVITMLAGSPFEDNLTLAVERPAGWPTVKLSTFESELSLVSVAEMEAGAAVPPDTRPAARAEETVEVENAAAAVAALSVVAGTVRCTCCKGRVERNESALSASSTLTYTHSI